MKRRDFLKNSACGIGAFAGVGTLGLPLWAKAPSRALTARVGAADLLGGRGVKTRIWGYDGTAPGPVLRYRQGDRLRIAFANSLPEASSIHWHGLRLPNAMDGVAGLTQKPVSTGGVFEYDFPLPDAGTYWYHAHNRSWEQMARGLYGMLIVEERTPPDVDHDFPFVVDDWLLENSGQIRESNFGNIHDWAHGGRLGNWLTVNGRADANLAVRAGDRVRLRVLNAANSRIIELGFDGHAPVVVALDGQPVTPALVPDGRLLVAPGQRADLIIDMALSPGDKAPVHFLDQGRKIEIAHFNYGPEASKRRPSRGLPGRLADNPLPGSGRGEAVRARLIMEGGAMGRMTTARLDGQVMGMNELIARGKVWSFNGQADMPKKPLLTARPGQPVIIEMINDNRWAHAMHLHGHHFRVVRRGDKAVRDAPLRDTELVLPGERVSLSFVAGGPGKWLLHCHMLEHQAGGMATWLEVA